MSYIRALSNPEAMYAYGGEKSRVYISANTLVDPKGNHIELSMPAHLFFALFRKWDREGYPELVRYRHVQLEEVAELSYRWRLSSAAWGNQSILAHKVTWFYVARSVIERP